MQIHLLVLWTVFAGLALGSPAHPTITATAKLGSSRRQDENGPGFFGYAQEGSQWVIQTCGGSMVFVTSSSFAACQPASQTLPNNIPSTCLEGSIIEYPATRATCQGDTNACMTILIHSDPNDDSPTSMLFCHTTTGEHNVYAKTTESVVRSESTTSSSEVLESSTTGPQATSEPPTSPTTSAGSTSVSTDPTQSGPPPASTSQDSNPSSPQNMAWIAGPVVGGIAGIVIIGLLIWIIKLRRRQKSMAYEVSSTTDLDPHHKSEAGHPLELHDHYKPGELHTEREPVELHPYSLRAELHNASTRSELDCPRERLELQG
ncbi:hypothetical protein HJFPF1_09710 [Paramyrothecium foliicola]|nr:hypothetical protein HJFPF1_09710 [Paramyrothecium foliicola]